MKADPADWRIARTVFVADDDTVAREYGRDASNSAYREYYKQMLWKMVRGGRQGVFKQHKDQSDESITLDYVLDECVIFGTVDKVVDEILALYEEVGWQLAAYAHGEFIAGYNDDTEEWFQIPMPPIATAIGVHVPGDGGYTAKEVPLVPRRFREFMALRTLQKWQDDHKHEVFGQVWVGKKEEAE